jgi:hypothetical protein
MRDAQLHVIRYELGQLRIVSIHLNDAPRSATSAAGREIRGVRRSRRTACVRAAIGNLVTYADDAAHCSSRIARTRGPFKLLAVGAVTDLAVRKGREPLLKTVARKFSIKKPEPRFNALCDLF